MKLVDMYALTVGQRFRQMQIWEVPNVNTVALHLYWTMKPFM